MVEGDLDIATAPRLRMDITERLRGQPSELVLDLSGVAFIDCAGLGALVAARTQASDAGTDLVLLRPSSSVERLLRSSATRPDFTIDLGGVDPTR